MTIHGQIKCPRCEKPMGVSCECVELRLNGQTRYVRMPMRDRFDGPFEITVKPDTVPVEFQRERSSFPWGVIAIVVTVLLAIAAFVIVSAP